MVQHDDRDRPRMAAMREEYSLAHGHATAIVHEHDLRRAHRAFE